jgi:hypothetical protein
MHPVNFKESNDVGYSISRTSDQMDKENTGESNYANFNSKTSNQTDKANSLGI